MVWMLFRALCCLCQNRDTVHGYLGRSGGGDYYEDFEDSEEDDEDESSDPKEFRLRALKVSRLKREAIDATTDVIIADRLLQKHGVDSSLLMYYDECSHEMSRTLERLPVGPRRTQVKAIKSACVRSRDVVV